MERYFTLSALIIISAMAVTDSLGDELQARWDMRIGYDRPIFQHLLNHYSFRERKETWPLRKESLLKLIEEYPDSTYAADAKLLLARGMFACEDDTEGAMRILYQVIQQHPDTPTIISSPTGEIDEVWLQNAPSRGRILADGTVRISPFPEIITAADRHFAEVLFYFEHREKFPNYAADVARLMAGGLLAKLGQLDKSLQEYEAVIRRHNGGKEILEADRLAGDMEHGILVAQSSRALVTAYAYIFHTHLLNENYAEAIKYGLTLAELRPSFDGRGESRLAEICVKAGDFETAEYLYEISLERFLNAAPRIYRDAETNITLLNQLLGAIEACRIARQTGKYDLERVTTNRGPFALERSRLNTWPPEDHEVRAKRRIREMDESYLRRSGGRWVKTYSREYGQRLWFWATVGLILKEEFHPDFTQAIVLQNWMQKNHVVVMQWWKAAGHTLQARRERAEEPFTVIRITPEDGNRFSIVDNAEEIVKTVSTFLSERFAPIPLDEEQPDVGRQFSYRFEDNIAFVRLTSPQVDQPALEVYAWLSEEDLILKIPNPILREATPAEATHYPPAKLLTLTRSLAALPEADIGRAYYAQLFTELTGEEGDGLEALDELLAYGGRWAFTGAYFAASSDYSTNAELRLKGANALVKMMKNMKYPVTPEATEVDRRAVLRELNIMMANHKDPQGTEYGSAETRIYEMGPKVTPILLELLERNLPLTVRETIFSLIGMNPALDHIPQVIMICAAEPDRDMRVRMCGYEMDKIVDSVVENWANYARDEGK